MYCPQCGFESPDDAECLRCGVIFAKLGPGDPSEESPAHSESGSGEATVDEVAGEEGGLYAPPEAEEGSTDLSRPLSPEALRVLAIGLGFSVLILAVPLFRFALSYLGVLVHELGHSALSWLFGYPAIPALDFTYGGGVSLTFGRRPVLVVGFILILVMLLGWAWRHPRWRWIAGGLVGLWVLASLTALHEMAILAMGHTAELLFAALCFHRAITGEGTERRAERPLYAMVGWFLVLQSLWFAWGLLTDPARRAAYEDAKGGGHWMDFSRLAEDYLGVDLSLVAAVFLAACVATPLAVLAVHSGFLDRVRARRYPSPEI